LEHKQLTDKLANGFDARAAKKLGEHKAIVDALKTWDKAKEVSSLNDPLGIAHVCRIVS
jgi:peptide chain release factor 1